MRGVLDRCLCLCALLLALADGAKMNAIEMVKAMDATPAPSAIEVATLAPTIAAIARTQLPTLTSTVAITLAPTQLRPTSTPIAAPTQTPTSAPIVVVATAVPTQLPTLTPIAAVTAAPTQLPTSPPIAAATSAPTALSTLTPTTSVATAVPTPSSTLSTTSVLTVSPTSTSTTQSTLSPSSISTAATFAPSSALTSALSTSPTLVATVAPTSAPTSTSCPKSWTASDLTCVSIAKRADSFFDARTKCQENNAYLLQFSDATVMAHVQAALPSNLVTWIGLADIYGTGTYAWQFGPLAGFAPTFKAWASTPENGGCAYMDFSTGLWYADSCSNRHNFTCMGSSTVDSPMKDDDFVSYSPTSAPSPSPVTATTSGSTHHNTLGTLGIIILVVGFAAIAFCGSCVYFWKSFGPDKDDRVGIIEEETKNVDNIELGEEKRAGSIQG